MAKKSYPSREERMKDLNQRLEQGIRDVFESERFRDYLAVMSRFHTYSARNVLLIHMQRPNATRVASAKRWKEQFERFINKVISYLPSAFVCKATLLSSLRSLTSILRLSFHIC